MTSQLVQKLTATSDTWGLTALRVPVGIVFAMVVAILSVHIGNGLFLSNNGYEFGLALLAASVALAISGAGKGSLDRALARRIA